jgi:D-alanine-D-alanine ligase
MGGPGSEREVSIATGQGVLRALHALEYDARSLDFDDRFVDGIRELAPDAVFIALHGSGGEDGCIQSILDWMNVPYTGSDPRASALAIDKHVTKKLIGAEGLPTPAWDVFDLRAGSLPLLPGSLNLPIVVKPRDEGSSAGVTIVKTHEEWSAAMVEAARRTPMMLAEEYIAGREFSCGVLFDAALPVAEILPNADFYTYAAKYEPGGSRHDVPARIDESLTRRLQTLALSVHRLLGLRDYSRTDFLVSKEGRPYILEINALPGLTPTSIFPDECAAIGIPFETLIDRLVQSALRRRRVASGAA